MLRVQLIAVEISPVGLFAKQYVLPTGFGLQKFCRSTGTLYLPYQTVGFEYKWWWNTVGQQTRTLEQRDTFLKCGYMTF